MKVIHNSKIQSLILAVALGTGLGFVSPVSSAQVRHAYIVDPNSKTLTDLGTLGGPNTSSSGINDAEQVVGASETDTFGGERHAFITGPNGVGMTD